MAVIPIDPKRTPPAVVLQDALDNVGDCKSVVVLWMDKDDVVRVDWSVMKRSQLAFMARLLDLEVDAAMKEDD